MRKRALIAVSLIALLGLSATVILRRPLQPEVVGSFTESDLNEIKRVVRAELKRDVIPDFSFDSFIQLPFSMKRNRGRRMIKICANPDGTVGVTVSPATGKNEAMGYIYYVQRSTDGWTCNGYNYYLEKSDAEAQPASGGNRPSAEQLKDE